MEMNVGDRNYGPERRFQNSINIARDNGTLGTAGQYAPQLDTVSSDPGGIWNHLLVVNPGQKS